MFVDVGHDRIINHAPAAARVLAVSRAICKNLQEWIAKWPSPCCVAWPSVLSFRSYFTVRRSRLDWKENGTERFTRAWLSCICCSSSIEPASVGQEAIIPIDAIRVDGDSIHLECKSINGAYDGTFNTAIPPLTFERDKEVTGAEAKSEQPIAVEIPLAPTAFLGRGKMHIVYELRIANSTPEEVSLKQIDILGNGLIASLSGAI